MSQITDGISTSEAHLLDRAITGDGAAFQILYQKHFDNLLARTQTDLCDDDGEDALEVAQQAFLDIFYNIQHIDRTVPFSESLWEAAQDRALHNMDDHTKLKRAGAFRELNEEFLRNDSTDAADPASISHKFHEASQQLAALGMLTTLHKASGNKHAAGIRYLFAMCENDLSAEEIAAKEDKTPAQIRKAIEKACILLRPALAPLLN